MRALFLLTFFALSACGHKDNAPAPAAATSAVVVSNNFQGGVCGDLVVSDFNDLRAVCRNPRDRGEAHRCRELAEAFLRSYPQASCSAQLQNPQTGEFRTRTIEERDVREILQRLQEQGEHRQR